MKVSKSIDDWDIYLFAITPSGKEEIRETFDIHAIDFDDFVRAIEPFEDPLDELFGSYLREWSCGPARENPWSQ